jgi:F0F1-type ATP synthase epsilon subunit
METGLGKFQLTVIDIDSVLYKNEVHCLFVPGDTGEFELAPFHYPVLTLLREGNLIIDWKEMISINRGVLKFLRNDCVAIVEVADADLQ